MSYMTTSTYHNQKYVRQHKIFIDSSYASNNQEHILD